MSFSPRPEVTSLPEGVHGVVGEAELEALGLRADQVVDFSVNTNPFGPSPLVQEAISRVDLARYPDPEARALVRALAEKLGLPPAQVMVGNGSLEVLWLLALACLRPGDKALILGPTFGEYERASRLHGAQVLWLRANEKDFQLDLGAAGELLRRERPRLTFLCQPNNPTGLYLG
ncbi:MAG: aminotransferase class I/II-fold pyridoxal phosphate-dependent enzyme, partial [Chloroflexota bacterium]|nr:aminotransferase class I/II-fold pyridoxal phosphate-dependent enzyme [Chloroflexota bacterium]